MLTCHCLLLSYLDITSWKHGTECSRASQEQRVSPSYCICGLSLWDKSKTTQWQPTRHLHAHKCKPKIKTFNSTFLLPRVAKFCLCCSDQPWTERVQKFRLSSHNLCLPVPGSGSSPVVTLLKVMASDTLPPSAIHILSSSCSLVKRYCSLGRI